MTLYPKVCAMSHRFTPMFHGPHNRTLPLDPPQDFLKLCSVEHNCHYQTLDSGVENLSYHRTGVYVKPPGEANLVVSLDRDSGAFLDQEPAEGVSGGAGKAS